MNRHYCHDPIVEKIMHRWCDDEYCSRVIMNNEKTMSIFYCMNYYDKQKNINHEIKYELLLAVKYLSNLLYNFKWGEKKLFVLRECLENHGLVQFNLQRGNFISSDGQDFI